VSNWVERQPAHSGGGRITQLVGNPAMGNFVKNDSNEDGDSPQSDLLDGVYQKRLAYSLLQHEYGKAWENTSLRRKTRSDGVMVLVVCISFQ
jgi:hypothetical protein